MQIHKFVSRAGFAALAAIGCAVAVAPSVATAQAASQLDVRWQPWIGCWKPAAPQGEAISYSTPRNSAVPLVCVIPSNASGAPSGVNVVTVKDGKIVARDTISASGQNFASSKDGCNGVESASWSADGHRVYVRSDFTCPGGLKRTSSGIFAMSQDGEWVNVQGVDANGSNGVRTLRYRDAGVPSTLPEEIASAIRDHDMAVHTARAAAGAPLSTADVVEASHKVDSSVVEAWIVDRGQNFGVDAKQLVALADAGVPGNVTDAMVAVSYPKAFVVNPTVGADGVSSIETDRATPSANLERSYRHEIPVMMVPEYSSFYSPFDFSYGYSPYGYSPYGYSPYGYTPYGYAPYGYSPYGGLYSPYAGYGGSYGGLYTPPIIVLKGGQPPAPRGYVVKGRGYTQAAPGNDGSSGSTAQPRPTYSPPPPSSQGGNSAPPPPPSSGRTAHQRP